MKMLLVAIGLLTVTGLSAQEFQPDINKLIAQSKLSNLNQDTSKPSLIPYKLDLNMLSSKAVKPGPGVYALPQDGMPCIVPDTESLAAMPNGAKELKVPPANRMPNAARTPAPKGESRAAEAK